MLALPVATSSRKTAASCRLLGLLLCVESGTGTPSGTGLMGRFLDFLVKVNCPLSSASYRNGHVLSRLTASGIPLEANQCISSAPTARIRKPARYTLPGQRPALAVLL